jgi:uncharacterized protein YukE
MGSQFSIEPKALIAVADAVDALLAEINGGAGYIAGNAKEFADASSIGAPLATFWGTAENVFAGAYSDAHGAITTTFTEIQQQLTNLSQAARNSAKTYQAKDDTSKHQVKQTLPSNAT